MFVRHLILALFINIYGILSVLSDASVKITDIEIDYLNPEYINTETIKGSVVNVNSTYARLPLHWEVIQDFPLDVSLKTRVIRYSDENDKEGQSLDVFEVSICNTNDPLWPYLPDFLIELTKSGHCVRKGSYNFENAGQFKFYDLLPKREIDGYIFNSINAISSSRAYIKKLQIQSISNV